MKFTSQPALVVTLPGAEVFQPYWETYMQACAETLAYTNKMTQLGTQLGMQAWQRSLSGPSTTAAALPQVGTFKAAPDVTDTVPDLLANMQQWQAAMLNNVSQWQQQVKDQFQGASASNLYNLNR